MKACWARVGGVQYGISMPRANSQKPLLAKCTIFSIPWSFNLRYELSCFCGELTSDTEIPVGIGVGEHNAFRLLATKIRKTIETIKLTIRHL